MTVTIDSTGTLIVTAQTTLETFALQEWHLGFGEHRYTLMTRPHDWEKKKDVEQFLARQSPALTDETHGLARED